MSDGGLRRCRDVEELLYPALPAIERALQAGTAVDAMAQRRAGLLVVDGLARVELKYPRLYLPRVLIDLCPRQPPRILGLRLAKLIRGERHRSIVGKAVPQ